MLKIDARFFDDNQKLLLKIANSKWTRWLLGLNRLPAPVRGHDIEVLTPSSFHYKDGERMTGVFFTRPRFAEALSFNLSPFSYLLREHGMAWRFSPIGALGFIALAALSFKVRFPMFAIASTTFYPTTNKDGVVYYQPSGKTWAEIHDAATGDGFSFVSGQMCGIRIFKWTGGFMSMWRSFFPIDTSSIPDTADITSATFGCYTTGKTDQFNDAYSYMGLVQATPANPAAIADVDYDQTGTEKGATDVDLTAWTTNAHTVYTLNATGLGWINKTGYTTFSVREGHDLENNSSGFSSYEAGYWTGELVLMIYSSAGGTSQDPYLTVTYQVQCKNFPAFV